MKVIWRHTISLILLVSLAVSVAVYIEYSRPVEDYFVHYGDVSTLLIFEYPSEITMYAFGRNADTDHPPDIVFLNSLYCRDIDSPSDRFDFIVSDGGGMYSFDYWNTIEPSLVSRRTEDGELIYQIGQLMRNKIRESGDESYGSYSLNDARPMVSSTCYTTTLSTTYSYFFNFSKSQLSYSNEFEYRY